MTLSSTKLPMLAAVAPLILAALAPARGPAVASKNVLADMFENAGLIGYLIVLLSIIALTLIIEDFLTIKRDKLAPPDLVDELEALFDEQSFQEALELCENERSYLTNVIAAGLGKLGYPFATIQTALREMQREEAVKLFQKIGWLALITAAAPMLGLFGTATDLFVTLDAFAAAGGSYSAPTLAYGIKMALVTTIFGLAVAIPVGAFCFVLRYRVVRTTIQVNALAEDLFERFRPKIAGD